MPKLKYEQIADSLRARIADGEFGPGAMLPSGRDLCEQWQVSRATVIKAMEILRGDGLVSARQGKGFQIMERPLARPAGQRRTGSSRIAGGRPFRRLGTPAREAPPDRVAAALGLAQGVSALRRERLVLSEDGPPLSLVTAWFPADIADACPRLAQNSPIPEGTAHYVTRQTGREPSRGRDITSAREATASEAERLEQARPFIVITVLHAAYDSEGRALVVEEDVTASERWELIDDYPVGKGN
jgi:DNA-binding GntR family transcriptional regulator